MSEYDAIAQRQLRDMERQSIREVIMKIKLAALNPRWMLGLPSPTPDTGEHSSDRGDMRGRYGMGISFDCPLHKSFSSRLHSRHRIKIFFTNPLDGLSPEHGVALWKRSGESFKALTVSPADDTRPECWHGFITNGELV
jgi:hypothetical protein